MDIRDIPQDLLQRSAQGDKEAFAELYKAASGFIYNVAYRIAGNREDAQEAAQEAFLRIFKYLKSFKFQSSFKTWVYRITVNAALTIRKKARAEQNRQVEFQENILTGTAGQEPAAENEIERSLNEKKISDLLNTLNPEQRACMVLREIEGLSYKEIAQALNININTVRTRLKRARETLLKRGGDK